MKDILVVDNNPVMLHTVAGLLKSQSNFFNVMPAVGIQKAIDILSAREFDLLLTGIQLPEEDAFNLALMMSSHQTMRIILLTHKASADFKQKISGIKSVVHFDHARDISMLTRRMFSELQIDFGGQLQATNLVSLLQMMELEERSGTLLVTTKGRSGTFSIMDGKPAAAKMGSMTGKHAALEMLTWENIAIDIDYTPPQVPCEINTSLMNLLLESGRLADDKRSQIITLRKHERYNYHLTASFEVGNWAFQGCLHDISEGGAYIETDQPVQVGQQLSLSLYSPSQDREAAIKGKVVRRDAKGVGVCFELLTAEQKRVIHSIVETGGLHPPVPSD